MPPLTLVSPFESRIFNRLSGKKVVFIVYDPVCTKEVSRISTKFKIKLQCVWIKGPGKLTEVRPEPEWAEIPIALQVQRMGRMRDLVKIKETLSRLNLRIYLPANTRKECADIRILSSLGFHCCGIIGAERDREVEWDALKDLAIYSLYSGRPKGDIDPFSYIAGHYVGKSINFRSVYLEDPSKFLHVDEGGRLSLSSKDQKKGIYLDLPLEQYEIVKKLEIYSKATQTRQPFLEENTKCVHCEVWQVCAGHFFEFDCNEGCLEFFREVLEGAKHFKRVRDQMKSTWRL